MLAHPAVTHPVLVIGVGVMGHRVARDLKDTAAVRPSGAGFAHCLLGTGGRAGIHLRDEMTGILQRLLEAGRVHGAREDGRARLDVAVIADIDEVGVEPVLLACRTVAELLAEQYGVLFPIDSPPDKRSAWMTTLLATPPLVRSPAGLRAIEGVRRLEAWADDEAVHPALSRIWLVPRQTTAGQLSDEAAEQSLRLFAQGLYLSGVRDHDEVRHLLHHRTDDRRLATVSVAAAELPVARLRQYARCRAAWDGFTTLVRLAERPATDEGRAQGFLSRLDVDGLLGDFREGDPAQRLRRHAAALTGLSDRLPARFHVGLLERDEDLRGRYGVLFERSVRPPIDADIGTDTPEHADLLRRLDQAEVAALEDARRRVDDLLDTELVPSTALEVLPDLEAALGRAQHTLEVDKKTAPPALPRAEPPPPPADPGLDRLQESLRSRPRLVELIPVAAVVALVVGLVGAMVVLALSEPPPPPAAAGFASSAATGTERSQVLPPVVGSIVGLGAGLVWLLALLAMARSRLVGQLRTRRRELEDLWNRGGSGMAGRQASTLLAVRERRTAEGIRRVVATSLSRLSALRTALRQARARALDSLEHLDVRLADAQRSDDLTGLLGVDTPLHHSLLPADLLAERIAATRATQDAARWAQVLLESTWPRAGLRADLPALDQAAITTVCDEQFQDLAASTLLRGPEVRGVVEDQLESFLSGVGGALAFGIRPEDQHGDPVIGTGLEGPMVIAPLDLRVAVEGALRDSVGRYRFAWGTASTPWVLVVRTWMGFRLDELARGAARHHQSEEVR